MQAENPFYRDKSPHLEQVKTFFTNIIPRRKPPSQIGDNTSNYNRSQISDAAGGTLVNEEELKQKMVRYK